MLKARPSRMTGLELSGGRVGMADGERGRSASDQDAAALHRDRRRHVRDDLGGAIDGRASGHHRGGADVDRQRGEFGGAWHEAKRTLHSGTV
jgi:hypothetical protein